MRPTYKFLNEAALSSILPPAPEFGAPVEIAPTPEVLKFLAARRSASAITLTGEAPSADELSDLLRLAARVPDHGKLAPWRFVILSGDSKTTFADRLEALAREKEDISRVAKLAKLRTPPLAVAVVSSPRASAIPQWEQLLSAGAVCVNLLYGALAMGYGANWITDWYSYDADALKVLGATEGERVAGFILIGKAKEAPFERERPNLDSLVSHWTS